MKYTPYFTLMYEVERLSFEVSIMGNLRENDHKILEILYSVLPVWNINAAYCTFQINPSDWSQLDVALIL